MIPTIVRVSHRDKTFLASIMVIKKVIGTQAGNVEMNKSKFSSGHVSHEGLEEDQRAKRLPLFRPHGGRWEKAENNYNPCHTNQFSKFKSINGYEKDWDFPLQFSGLFN